MSIESTPYQPPSWDDLFPGKEFGFAMRFRREDPRVFFHPSQSSEHDAILEERARWIDQFPQRSLALTEDGEDLMQETWKLAHLWASQGTAPDQDCFSSDLSASEDRLHALGRYWEPDYLLLNQDSEGVFRLRGGSVCFPSSWSLEEKIGQSMAFIHGPVPGLNDALGQQIDAFLAKIKPDIAWMRENWGLSASPELNQHPARSLPRLQPDCSIDQIWLRIEHQALVGLPQSKGVLFGIRLSINPLSEVRQHRQAAQAIRRELETMPDDMAEYKNILNAKPRILELLQ